MHYMQVLSGYMIDYKLGALSLHQAQFLDVVLEFFGRLKVLL